MTEEIVQEEYKHKAYGHGRPIWQLILIYLIIAIVVYGIVYYFFLGRRNSSSPSSSPTNTSQPAY